MDRHDKTGRILFVDADDGALTAMGRTLADTYDILLAADPEEAELIFRLNGPFAAVAAAASLPGTDGALFLSRLRAFDENAARILLDDPGKGIDLATAINDARLSRLLPWPCPLALMVQTLDEALARFRQARSEKAMLQRTVRGCVDVLTQMLALANPRAYGRAERLSRFVRRLRRHFSGADFWKLELAAMLSHIGCVSMPEGHLPDAADPDEDGVFYSGYPEVGAQLIRRIPHLEDVAAIVAAQLARPDAEAAPPGGRLLHLALEYDRLMQAGVPKAEAIDALRADGWDTFPLFRIFERTVFEEEGYVLRTLPLQKLRPGMVLDDAVIAPNGVVLLAAGKELGEAAIVSLNVYARTTSGCDKVSVRVPFQMLERLPEAGSGETHP